MHRELYSNVVRHGVELLLLVSMLFLTDTSHPISCHTLSLCHTLLSYNVSSLMKVIWPMLFSERLSRVTTSNFGCQSCCQLLEIASNRYKTFKLAVHRIEEAFSSSGHFPASYLTSAFTINVLLPPDDERSTYLPGSQ